MEVDEPASDAMARSRARHFEVVDLDRTYEAPKLADEVLLPKGARTEKVDVTVL